MSDHDVPIPALGSPYFEHFLGLYEPLFGTLSMVSRYLEAAPDVLRYGAALPGPALPRALGFGKGSAAVDGLRAEPPQSSRG